MRINHNIAALNTYRQLGNANNAQSKSMEKLSSGLRINNAADDAAGLAISEKMRGQIRGLDMAAKNSQDGISLIQTAEGALNETHDMLQRMRELAVQANNGTNTQEDREKIQDEISNLQTEITKTAERTQFNKQDLLKGTFGAKIENAGSNVDGSSKFKVSYDGAAAATDYTITTDDGTNDSITISSATLGVSQTLNATDITSLSAGDSFNFDKLGIKLSAVADGDYKSISADNTFEVNADGVDLQVGANTGQQMSLTINDMRASALGSAGQKIDAINVGAAAWDSAQYDIDLAAIDDAITQVSNERSKMGAWQNRLDHTINNLSTSSENLTAAESRIRDVDYALAA
ncbi:flagellin N-terminal helical domain-containing protein [Virgibacillus halodenitrificans]|uniref:flagellin N-terminal helical domain-containing protein n=1 Tax=Virgibacillus halodenitrificans TaxID=1482 RepID=UPI00045D0ABB|nr:flagellin [Virgibacillus halodenitrificans]CDQ31379.1 Flagellin [Virgibacillus halodenitrificans]